MNKSNTIGYGVVCLLMVFLLPGAGWGEDEGRPHRIKPLNPLTSCGWIDQKSGKNLISRLEQGLEELGGLLKDHGEFQPEVMEGINIHIEKAPHRDPEGSTIVWCITRDAPEKGREIVKEIAMNFEDDDSKDKETPTMSTTENLPTGDGIASVLESLKKSGYWGYITRNVDHILFYDRPFECTNRHKICFGEADCEFSKTASVVVGSLGIMDTAALWVHEAAHLEGCYNNENYAVEKEWEFRRKAYPLGAGSITVSELARE